MYLFVLACRWINLTNHLYVCKCVDLGISLLSLNFQLSMLLCLVALVGLDLLLRFIIQNHFPFVSISH
jgi:hypothetical protein